MIEQAIRTSLSNITKMSVHPLALPSEAREGVTFQRISDPTLGEVDDSGIVAIRMQIAFILLDDYSRLLTLDRAVWRAWRPITHGTLEGQPVQRIERAGLHQDFQNIAVGKVSHRQYRLVRDYLFICSDLESDE